MVRSARRRFFRHFLVCLAVLLTAASTALAQQEVWVDEVHCVDPGTGTPGDPYCRIQDAICWLNDNGGGTVWVLPGTYYESLRMFGGISVRSTDGPDVTTIDATGQPCTTAQCQPSTENLSCSVIVYGSGPTNADRLEGFTITGGSGLPRDIGLADQFVVGAGIFIYNSEPTITLNYITGNLINHGVEDRYWYGAGVYAAGPAATVTPLNPVITYNLINNNVADPPNGQGSRVSYGVGGGIYIDRKIVATIEGNTIENNSVGDVAKDKQVAGGGGIAIYSHLDDVTISRNVVRSNVAADYAGGLSLGEFYDGSVWQPSMALVENNVFEYNDAYSGGAMTASTTTAVARNNTITDNTATNVGGAVLTDRTGDVALQMTFVNNLLTFNSAGYAGGALYVYQTDPVVEYNDLFGNSPENVAGEKTDVDYIGQNGNIEVDPDYESRSMGNRNLRLKAQSPVIDIGDDARTGTIDLDGAPRIQDADYSGNPRVDFGAFEFSPDWDNDGDPNWSDPDDDNDGVDDGSDCAPYRRSVSEPSGQPWDLKHGRAKSKMRWAKGRQGHTSNVYRGSKNAGEPWAYNEVCLFNEEPGHQQDDLDDPPVGSFFYYLVGGKNKCNPESPIHRDSSGTDIFPTVTCAEASRNTDTDSWLDVEDNCPKLDNEDQADSDMDFAGDACDNCAGLYNEGQANSDADTVGDACDNCPTLDNETQDDLDADTVGDVCDNCVSVSNTDQLDTDLDGLGNACDDDDDGDGILDGADNCPLIVNGGQENFDGDAEGDACDDDDDNDGVADGLDCDPFNAGATVPPGEVTGLQLAGGLPTTISWNGQEAGTRFDVAGGTLVELAADSGVDSASCLQDDETTLSWEDTRPDPAIGGGYYYLLRAQNTCGDGGYGTDGDGLDRLPAAACP